MERYWVGYKRYSLKSCKVKFYNYNIQKYAYDLIDESRLTTVTPRNEFFNTLTPKNFRIEDTFLIKKSDKHKIMYIFDEDFMSKVDDVIITYSRQFGYNHYFPYYNKQKTFVSKILDWFRTDSIDVIKIQVEKQFKFFNIILRFITSINLLLSEFKNPCTSEDSKAIVFFQKCIPKELIEEYETCKDLKELNDKVLTEILSIPICQTNYDEKQAYKIALFLKHICLHSNLIEILISDSESSNLNNFCNYLSIKMKFDLIKYIRSWVKTLLSLSHQDTPSCMNSDYQIVLKLFKFAEKPFPNQVVDPIPHYIFVDLCNEIQYFWEYKQVEIEKRLEIEEQRQIQALMRNQEKEGG